MKCVDRYDDTKYFVLILDYLILQENLLATASTASDAHDSDSESDVRYDNNIEIIKCRKQIIIN